MPRQTKNPVTQIEHLERLLLKMDAFISDDPELSVHTGQTVAALLMLAGGMLYSSDTHESFEVAEKHARALLRVGFDHQKKAAEQ